MLTTTDKRDWSDIRLGELLEDIPSGMDDVYVKIKFDDGVRPFPSAPFMFVIGGTVIEDGVSVDRRESVMCKSSESAVVYLVSRDPLDTGKIPPSHKKGEAVYQSTMAGTIFSTVKQLDRLSNSEGQISFLEEILLPLFQSVFGSGNDVVLLPVWEKYDRFLVEPVENSKEIKIQPGMMFVRDKNNDDFVKLLVVSPNMNTYNRSMFKISFPNKGRQNVLVYIDVSGEIVLKYGLVELIRTQTPPPINVESLPTLVYVLASILIDSDKGRIDVGDIVDLRSF